MAIKFYKVRGQKYGCFSNFSPHGFWWDGRWWATSEHFFQAMKFEGTEHEEEVRLASSPKEAATKGRERSRPLRAGWEDIKLDVMYAAIYHKFTQNSDIRWVLLSTGDEDLIEDSPVDWIWGVGADGKGENWLGILMVRLREELRLEQA